MHVRVQRGRFLAGESPSGLSLVGHDSEVFMNIAVLADGCGIEAWIMLDEKEMNVIEADMEMGESMLF